MNLHETVTDHYGHGDISERVVAALVASGVDTSRLAPEVLAPVDQLHAGFHAATTYVLDALAIGTDSSLLDVGCGIGGPARMAASRGARVVGVDLTDGFVATARSLTELTGLSDRATFLTSPADSIALPDATFAAAMMIHVGMNIPDKRGVFAEVRRLLEPGGRFAVYDQVRVGEGELTHPLPWALDESSSFVASPEEYAADLAAVGFAVDSVEDRTGATSTGPPAGVASGLSPALIFGPDFRARVANNVADTDAGRLGAFLLVATAT